MKVVVLLFLFLWIQQISSACYLFNLNNIPLASPVNGYVDTNNTANLTFITQATSNWVGQPTPGSGNVCDIPVAGTVLNGACDEGVGIDANYTFVFSKFATNIQFCAVNCRTGPPTVFANVSVGGVTIFPVSVQTAPLVQSSCVNITFPRQMPTLQVLVRSDCCAIIFDNFFICDFATSKLSLLSLYFTMMHAFVVKGTFSLYWKRIQTRIGGA